MLEFHSVTLDDKDFIKKTAYESNTRISENSFGILFGWQDSFSPRIMRRGDMLLATIDVGKLWYTWPLGNGDIYEALTLLKKDSVDRGIPFRLCHIPENALPMLEDKFDILLDAGFSDYVYSAEKLAALSGHAYHSKKNHLNRFVAENKWSFEELNEANIPECREMLKMWFAQNGEQASRYDDEARAIDICFDNYASMGFDGGLIRTENGVVAFTMGELLCRDTFNSHFEKAFSNVNGAYAAINRQFAVFLRSKYPDLVYINREEDMGLDSLRRAKESYHPEFLVHKYAAVEK